MPGSTSCALLPQARTLRAGLRLFVEKIASLKNTIRFLRASLAKKEENLNQQNEYLQQQHEILQNLLSKREEELKQLKTSSRNYIEQLVKENSQKIMDLLSKNAEHEQRIMDLLSKNAKDEQQIKTLSRQAQELKQKILELQKIINEPRQKKIRFFVLLKTTLLSPERFAFRRTFFGGGAGFSLELAPIFEAGFLLILEPGVASGIQSSIFQFTLFGNFLIDCRYFFITLGGIGGIGGRFEQQTALVAPIAGSLGLRFGKEFFSLDLTFISGSFLSLSRKEHDFFATVNLTLSVKI